MAQLNGITYDLSNPVQREAYWNEHARINLLGKKIVGVRYITQEEANNLGWNSRSLAIQLNDGTLIYPSMDDEGNNAGALFGQKPNAKGNGSEDLTFPVL